MNASLNEVLTKTHMWDSLPRDVQDAILRATGESPSSAFLHDLVYADDARESRRGWRRFAQRRVMTTVRGIAHPRGVVCDLRQTPLRMHPKHAAKGEGFSSWDAHFTLRFAHTACDGRLWVDDSLSGWTHAGYYGDHYTVFRYPHACRLGKAFAERRFTGNAILFHRVRVQEEVPNESLAMSMDSVPAVLMQMESWSRLGHP